MTLAENQTTEIISMSCPEPPAPSSALPAPPATTRSHSVVVGARLIDARTGDVLARFADWPQPYRYLDFPDPGLRLTVERDNVLIEVARPAKGLVLSIDGGDEVGWSDNALDVMPGDPQALVARGLAGRRLRVAYLGSGQSRVIVPS